MSGVAGVDPAVLEALAAFDSPTVFNALVELDGGKANEDYTDHTVRCLLPGLGPVVGCAVTAELTTNDADSPQRPWRDYYEWLGAQPGPLVAVLQDVDSRPGRGASFGDGMAHLHRRLGVRGVIVEGTVRDLPGIERAGLPVWGRGQVPGHGPFHLVRFGESVIAGQMRVHTGDVVVADADGCVRLPAARAAEVVAAAGRVRDREAGLHGFLQSEDFSLEEWWRRTGG